MLVESFSPPPVISRLNCVNAWNADRGDNHEEKEDKGMQGQGDRLELLPTARPAYMAAFV